jgi:hypothetical protein
MLNDLAQVPIINVKFAQPIYDIQEFAYKRIESVYQRAPEFIKDRKLLQWLGTEWGRDSISKSLWIDIWKAEVNRLRETLPGTLIVCDDVRFDNEGEAFKQMGGKLVKIVADRSELRTVSGIANHSSEAGISQQYIDFIVENNGTLDDLRSSISYLYRRHLVPATGEVEPQSA